MPNMIKPRHGPGCFKNKNFLYAFGGYERSVERFDIEKEEWELLNTQMPEELNGIGY